MSEFETFLVDLAGENDETIHTNAYDKMRNVFSKNTELNSNDFEDFLLYFKRDLQNEQSVAIPAMSAFSDWCRNLKQGQILDTVDFIISLSKLSQKNVESIITILKSLCLKSPASKKNEIYLKTGTYILNLAASSKLSDTASAISITTSSELFDYNATPNFCNTNIVFIKMNLLLICHESDSVRKESGEVLKKQFDACFKNAGEYVKYYAGIIEACKQALGKCQKLFTGEDVKLNEVLKKQCPILLSFFGAHLKKSTKLTNSILSIVEKGFCNSGEVIRISAFRLWRNLIFYYSKDLKVISSERYTKLFLQPLKSPTFQNHSEKATIEKIKTFWLLIQGVKQNVFDLFNTLCLPLLHLCLGGLNTNGRGSPHNSSRRSSLSSGVPEDKFLSQLAKFGFVIGSKTKSSIHPSCQILGAEALVHFLNCSIDRAQVNAKVSFTLGNLDATCEQENNFFSRYSLLFTEAASVIFKYLNNQVPEKLLQELWTSLHQNVLQTIIENLKKKKTEAELFNSYFSLLRIAVRSNKFSNKLCVKMLSDSSEIPESILSSTFYGNGGSNMHITPATTILSMLMIIGNSLKDDDGIKSVIAQSKPLLKYSLTGSRVFDFLRRIVEVFRSCIDDINNYQVRLLLGIWDNLALFLSAHIRKTQEINEGDAADHDYSTIYDILFIPFNIVENLNTQDEGLKSVHVENLMELFKSVLWADNFVTTSEPNEISFELVSKLNGFCKTKFVSTKILALDVLDVISSEVQKLSCSQDDDYDFLHFLDNWKFIVGLMKDDEKLSGRNLVCVSNLFKNRLKGSTLCISFVHFMPTWKLLLETTNIKIVEKCLRSFTEIVKIVHDAKHDEVAKLLLDCKEWDFVLFAALNSKLDEVKNTVLEFYNDGVVKSQYHDEFCNKYSTDMQDLLLPMYNELGWNCPWDASIVRDSDDSNNSKINTSNIAPPKISYGVYNSPQKKSMLSPFKPKQSPKAKSKTRSRGVSLKKVSTESKKLKNKPEIAIGKENDSESCEFQETPKKAKTRITRTSKGKSKSPKAIKSNKRNKKKDSVQKKDDSLIENLSEELDVTPLDESYEVNMVDMSINAAGKSMVESTFNDENSLNNTGVSERSCVDVADMSCGQTFNCSDDLAEESTKNTSSESVDQIELTVDISDKSTSLSEVDCTNVTENSYHVMMDMSCNVSLSKVESPKSEASFEDESVADVHDMSCAPMSNNTTFESVEESFTEDKENESTNRLSTIAENSLISEDQSYADETLDSENESVFSNAHSTCNYGKNETSPVMHTDTSPIVKSPLQVVADCNGISPSSKSILKRKSFIFTADVETPSPKRRVSFAYPISESKAVAKVTSPKSAIIPNASSPVRTVSRKLSLPEIRNIPPTPQSPLSLRSVKVAAAIADIRTRDGKTNERLCNIMENGEKEPAKKSTSFKKKDYESLSTQELLEIIHCASNILLERNLSAKSTN